MHFQRSSFVLITSLYFAVSQVAMAELREAPKGAKIDGYAPSVLGWCGDDVTVYEIWLPSIPNGQLVGANFVIFKGVGSETSGLSTRVESIRVKGGLDQGRIIAQSASITMTANSDGTGEYQIAGGGSGTGCQLNIPVPL